MLILNTIGFIIYGCSFLSLSIPFSRLSLLHPFVGVGCHVTACHDVFLAPVAVTLFLFFPFFTIIFTVCLSSPIFSAVSLFRLLFSEHKIQVEKDVNKERLNTLNERR